MAINYKILGQSAPADTNNTDLYTVPIGTQTVVSTIHIANVSSSDATVKVFVVASADSPTNANLLIPDSVITAKGFISITAGVTLGVGDKLVVRTSAATAIAFHAFGSEVSA